MTGFKNITKVENKSLPNSITADSVLGGAMTYNYTYDNLYRLKSSNGMFIGYGTGVNAKMDTCMLYMEYEMYNITRNIQ